VAAFSLKCHLCGTYLSESSPIWNVGGRRRVAFRCLDQKCGLIKVVNRSVIEIILPDEDIVSYQLLISSGEKWYRIWGRVNSEEPNDTSISNMDVGRPNATGKEQFIINVPRFYPLHLEEDLYTQAQEMLKKLKNLVIFS